MGYNGSTTSKSNISAVNSLCMLHNIMYLVRCICAYVCVYAFTKFNLQVDMSGLTFALNVSVSLSNGQTYSITMAIPWAEMHLLCKSISCITLCSLVCSLAHSFAATKVVLYTLQQTLLQWLQNHYIKMWLKLFLFVQF